VWIESQCGAWPVDADADGAAVQFRLFFPAGTDPQIAGIRVAGSFQSATGGTDWDFDGGLALTEDTTDPRGTFWTARTDRLPKGFYEYKYQVVFDDPAATRRIVSDPCARYGGLEDDNSGVVVGGSSPADNVVTPLAGGRRPVTDLVVYELMIDDFTAEFRLGRAPIDAVVDKLDDLAGLGFTAILFMPWTDWGDLDFNWGYEPGHYFALAARYAHVPGESWEKISRLKALISECHRRGIHVLMDGVFNHSGPAFPYPDLYLHQAQCPFTAQSFGGDFGGALIDLDFHEQCTNDFILDVCSYWMDTFGIDGIRFDAAAWYTVAGDPHQGLPELLSNISSRQAAHGETNFTLMLEYLDLSAAQITNTTAATSFWDDAVMAAATRGLSDQHLDPALLNALNDRFWLDAPDTKAPTVYLSNHDHPQIGWAIVATDPGSGITGQWWRLQPYLIALYTGTGVPLIPNGQEFGSDHYLPDNDHTTGRRVLSRPVQWKLATDPIGASLSKLHAVLARLRATRTELRSPDMQPQLWPGTNTQLDSDGLGVDPADELVVFRRGKPDDGPPLVVVINFSQTSRTVDIPGLPGGTWADLLTGPDNFGDSWTSTPTDGHLSVPVDSNWGRILAPIGG
jgi:pullulanase/glycogen debranching enzyme